MKRKNKAFESLAGVGLDDSVKYFIVEYSLDHDHRRAARVAGISPIHAANLLSVPMVQEGIKTATASIYGAMELDSDIIQEELFMAYNIAMQTGKIAQASKFLDSIAKLQTIDAFASQKITIQSDVDFIEELRQGRVRVNEKQNALKEQIH